MARLVIGADEVGLGAVLGPVVAAAVVLPSKSPIEGLGDSKKIAHNRRVQLARTIMTEAPFWAITLSGVPLINKHGIARCHRDCMRVAVLVCREEYPEAEIILDGDRPIHELGHHRCIVKADTKIAAVSAASIIAKVHRDELVVRLASKYPRYDLENNKGYGTAKHLKALKEHGVTKHHRKDYAPVRRLIEGI